MKCATWIFAKDFKLIHVAAAAVYYDHGQAVPLSIHPPSDKRQALEY